eukprot:3560053-Rhodomonas_salina.1
MWEFSETAWKRRQKRREEQTNNKKGPRAASLGQGSAETESSAASTVMSSSSPCPEATIMPPIVLGLPVFPYPEQPDNIIHHPLSCVFPKQPPSSSFPMTSSPSACPSISHPAATTGHKSGDLAYAPTEVQTHAPASQNSTDARTRNVSSSAQKADSEIWAHHTFKLENLSLSELEQHPFQTQPLHHHPTCEFPSHPASSAAHPEIPTKPKVAPAEGRHPSVSLQHHPAQVHVPCQPNPAAAFAECEARSASQHPISNPSAESRQLGQVLPGACAGLGADQTEAKVTGGGVRPRGRRAAGGKQEKGRAAKSVSTELSMPEVAAALLDSEAVEASAELQKRADVLRGPSKPAPSSRAGAQKKLKGSAAAPPSPSPSNALAEGVRSGPAEEHQPRARTRAPRGDGQGACEGDADAGRRSARRRRRRGPERTDHHDHDGAQTGASTAEAEVWVFFSVSSASVSACFSARPHSDLARDSPRGTEQSGCVRRETA